MKILFNYFSGGGGGFSNIIMLLRAMASEFPRDEIHIASSSSADWSMLSGFPNIKVHVVGGVKNGEFERLVHGLFGLQRLAAELDVDLIWSMNLGSYFKGSIPQVVSINNAYQAYPISVIRYHPAGVVRAFVLRLFSLLSIFASSGILVQTNMMRQKLSKYASQVRSIAVVPKAVESCADVGDNELTDSIQRQMKSNLGVEVFTLLYVATALPHKNHKTIIEAIRLLRKNRVSVRLVLTLSEVEAATRGVEGVMEMIREGSIVPVGWIRKENVRALYRACDACLMPSLLESQSSAHLEAMSWGKPQIVSDLAYSRDICADAAIYADPKSPSDWASRIVTLISSKDHRDLLVAKGCLRMSEYPESWSSVSVSVHAYLESVAER